MNTYIGTKIVQAEPMTDAAFHDVYQRAPGGPISPSVARPGYKVVYEDGYVSWSPKDVFERSYRRVTDAERVLVAHTPTTAPS